MVNKYGKKQNYEYLFLLLYSKLIMKIRKITPKTENKKLKQIFDFLVKNINNTTFELFGYNFFLDTLKINSKNCFI